MDMMNGSDTAEAEVKTVVDVPAASAKPRPRFKVKKAPAKRTVVPSTISFPYRDLDSAISVALAIFKAGGVGLTSDQLAGVMNLTAGSGNFMVRVAAARMFGLVTYTAGKYELTNPLGFEVVDNNDQRQRKARAEAFLNVPLFRRAYDEFKGKPLPPRPLGLEQAFMRFGVSVKQKDTARLIFDKSAGQAGFFQNGIDRLVEPIIGSVPPPPGRPPVDEGGGGGGGGGGGPAPSGFAEGSAPYASSLHPFIQGLLETLPEPGTNWKIEGRAKWLQAAAHCFDLIYKGAGEIQINASSIEVKDDE